MPPVKKAAAAKALPPITVGRFRALMAEMESVVKAKQVAFVAEMRSYREVHRDGSSRPLNAQEIAQLTAGLIGAMGDGDPVALAEQIQASNLTAYDEPGGQEVLLAAGLSTAPALLDAVSRLVALVEMPASLFEAAVEGQTLDAAITAAVAAMDGSSLQDGRDRATRALEHLAQSAGVSVGEALGLPGKLIQQAMTMAAHTMGPPSTSSSLTGSLEHTDGPAETSSTEPPGPTQ